MGKWKFLAMWSPDLHFGVQMISFKAADEIAQIYPCPASIQPLVWFNFAYNHVSNSIFRADSRLVPSQWETLLQSNAISHWLGAYLESTLILYMHNILNMGTIYEYLICLLTQDNVTTALLIFMEFRLRSKYHLWNGGGGGGGPGVAFSHAQMKVSFWKNFHPWLHKKLSFWPLFLCQRWNFFSMMTFPFQRKDFFQSQIDIQEEHPMITWPYRSIVTTDHRVFINSLRPRQNGRHFADDIFKRIFVNENIWIPIKISLKFIPKGSINNTPAMVQIMAWRLPGDKPLSEPMMDNLQTHICVTRPYWVKHDRIHSW